MPRKKKDEVATFAPKKRPVIAFPSEVAATSEELSARSSQEAFVKKENIPLWEAKWNEQALREKRASMGAREFDRGYRQRAISDEDLFFKSEWIDAALDRNLSVPDTVTKDSFWYKFPRDAGVDLAIATADKEAAYFVVFGVCTTRDWHRWAMTMHFSRGLTFGQQTAVIMEFQDRYKFDIVTVESNAYQEALVRHFTEEGAGGRVPVTGFHTGRIQKVDVELGIPGMAVEFEQGRWHIPYGDARSRRIMEPFIEELRTYPTPGSHDDAVMASFLARESRRMGDRIVPQIRIFKF